MFGKLFMEFFFNQSVKTPVTLTTTKLLRICNFLKDCFICNSFVFYLRLIIWVSNINIHAHTTTKQFISYIFLTFFFLNKTFKVLIIRKFRWYIVDLAHINCWSIRRKKIFEPIKVIWFLLKFMKDYEADRTKKWNDYHQTYIQKIVDIYIKLGYLKSVSKEGIKAFYAKKVKSPTYVTVKEKKNILSNTPKYSSSSICKFLPNSLNMQFQFLRKNKVYNKGRYSRCRQNYRTGVYMCMYLSILSIFGLYYWFLKFTFNFTYLWWLFIIFISSFFVPQIIKYNLYNPVTLLGKFISLWRWFLILIRSVWY